MCSPDGTLREVVPSRGKNNGANREMWRFVKRLWWGDRFPATLETKVLNERVGQRVNMGADSDGAAEG